MILQKLIQTKTLYNKKLHKHINKFFEPFKIFFNWIVQPFSIFYYFLKKTFSKYFLRKILSCFIFNQIMLKKIQKEFLKIMPYFLVKKRIDKLNNEIHKEF